ncbi:TRAP transporter small permease [Chelativorans intermedius]|uniref:TRAP transporter small permease protein n=1 Tax=Chelativorans intermedius TaxID=515947 RepID=A0ABV6DCT3_9HYPH|nr:TRAP transporter small permease subunit [Chelativorans intermedius]MCT9000500.1 TRAP transporter small permease subunit [Chelativorans intermedius]
MQLLEKFFTWIVNFFAVLAGLLLVAIMLATVFKVGLRGVAGRGIIGIDQLSGTAMVYMTFLGGVWVLRHNAHVTVDLVLSGARTAVRRNLIVLNSVVGAIICFVVSYYGFVAVQTSLARGIMVVQELEIPRAIGLFPIPVGALLLGIEFVRRALAAHRGAFDDEQEPKLEA